MDSAGAGNAKRSGMQRRQRQIASLAEPGRFGGHLCASLAVPLEQFRQKPNRFL
jgi:hypothetical protein